MRRWVYGFWDCLKKLRVQGCTLSVGVCKVAPMSETKPRTCCDTHRDTCQFGRQHHWSSGWFGGAKSGLGFGEDGWHDSPICSTCMGVCVADLEEGQRA